MDQSNDIRKTIEDKNYYVPECACGGILQINFDLDKLKINYQCDKNNHIRENIFLETFEKYNLKRREFYQCNHCLKNLSDEEINKCLDCGKFYCTSCFLNDIHIKNNKNKREIKNKKCIEHDNNQLFFCFKCNKFVCNKCLIKGNGCQGHDSNNVCDIIPPKNIIDSINNEIKKKKNILKILFN